MLRLALVLFGDLLAGCASLLAALYLRMEFRLPPEYSQHLPLLLAMSLGFKAVALRMAGLYSVAHSYISLRDALRIIAAIALSSAALVAAFLALRGTGTTFEGFPLSALLIDGVLALAMIGVWRFSKRIRTVLAQVRSGGTPTLVIGAGEAADQVLRNMLSDPRRTFAPIALVAEEAGRVGTTLHGFPVDGTVEEVPDILSRLGVTTVVIAVPRAPVRRIRQIYDLCRQAGARVILVYPDTSEMFREEFSLRDLRRIELKDLLKRDEIRLDEEALSPYYGGAEVMVTGAAGSIGSELCRQVARLEPAELILLDREETGLFKIREELAARNPSLRCTPLLVDLCDRERLAAALRDRAPRVVFHAAAYKHVPMLESHAQQALLNNVGGTLLLARASIAAGVEKFVLISTDKAADPISVMGKSKRVGELLARHFDRIGPTRFVSVRFGNVLGSRGSVLETFQEQIRHGRAITVTDPRMTRYFMLVSEAVQLVLHAGALGRGGETFVLDMGEPVRIQDLAEQMARLAGLEPGRDIAIETTGLRPGERLHERLHCESETLEPSQHPKLLIATDGAARPALDPEAAVRSAEEAAFRMDGRPAHEILDTLLKTL